MLRPAMAAVSALGLCGCTTAYAPLYSPSAVQAAPAAKTSTGMDRCKLPSDPLDQTLGCAEVLQAVYSKGYVESSNIADLSQLPIVGAAAWAAYITLKGKDEALKRVGRIGLGAAAYVAARDQLIPADASGIFVKGHAALGCVIAYGDDFRIGTEGAAMSLSGNTPAEGGSAIERWKRSAASQFLRSMQAVENARADVANLRFSVTAPQDDAAAAELLQTARALADEALKQSATQLETSAGQAGALLGANKTFRKAVTDIAAWVATKGRARPAIGYADLVSSFAPSPSGSGAGPQGDTDRENFVPANTIQALAEATTRLASETVKLKGVTPDYRSQLIAVEKCASDLSSG